jgi:hypothetical protein
MTTIAEIPADHPDCRLAAEILVRPPAGLPAPIAVTWPGPSGLDPEAPRGTPFPTPDRTPIEPPPEGSSNGPRPAAECTTAHHPAPFRCNPNTNQTHTLTSGQTAAGRPPGPAPSGTPRDSNVRGFFYFSRVIEPARKTRVTHAAHATYGVSRLPPGNVVKPVFGPFFQTSSRPPNIAVTPGSAAT